MTGLVFQGGVRWLYWLGQLTAPMVFLGAIMAGVETKRDGFLLLAIGYPLVVVAWSGFLTCPNCGTHVCRRPRQMFGFTIRTWGAWPKRECHNCSEAFR